MSEAKFEPGFICFQLGRFTENLPRKRERNEKHESYENTNNGQG